MWKGLAFLLALLILPAAADPASQLAGGKVEWARLKTPSPSWNRHASSDHFLLQYIRDSTTLNIDPTWRAADVNDLNQMCVYPFLFSEGLGFCDQQQLANLREYIQRGGFLFIDSCIAPQVNPREDQFITIQMQALSAVVPDLRMTPIPEDHEVFHNCFDMIHGLPNTRVDDQDEWPVEGMTAIYSKNRLVGILSVSGLQCGWAGIIPSEEHCTECMKMMINIYVYAITH